MTTKSRTGDSPIRVISKSRKRPSSLVYSAILPLLWALSNFGILFLIVALYLPFAISGLWTQAFFIGVLFLPFQWMAIFAIGLFFAMLSIPFANVFNWSFGSPFPPYMVAALGGGMTAFALTISFPLTAAHGAATHFQSFVFFVAPIPLIVVAQLASIKGVVLSVKDHCFLIQKQVDDEYPGFFELPTLRFDLKHLFALTVWASVVCAVYSGVRVSSVGQANLFVLYFLIQFPIALIVCLIARGWVERQLLPIPTITKLPQQSNG